MKYEFFLKKSFFYFLIDYAMNEMLLNFFCIFLLFLKELKTKFGPDLFAEILKK